MFQDAGNLPIAGGALVAAILYAGVSIFVTGPLVGERTIMKSDWPRICQSEIRAELELSQPISPALPRMDCNSIMGGFFGRDGQAWCNAYGGSFQMPFAGTLEAIEGQKRDLQNRRLELAASRTATRCDCAASAVLETERTSFALYAGSLRLVSPPAVKNLSSGLRSALSLPHCAMKG